MDAFDRRHLDFWPWPPLAVSDLTAPERLIVCSFRRWLVGWARQDASEWSEVWEAFARAFGAAEGKAALSLMTRLINGLYLHARRTLHYHQPCCPCLGGDEAIVLQVIAACQRHDRCAAHAAAASLVDDAGRDGILRDATALAEILHAQGMLLPRREVGRSEAPAAAPANTVPYHRGVSVPR